MASSLSWPRGWRRRRALEALNAISDPHLQAGIIDLFDDAKHRVEHDGVDLVILCARRLPCLYQVLLRAGYDPIENALVVSDRYLDIPSEWRWRNVLILDDTVVLGTTLTRIHKEVMNRVDAVGGGTVQTAAICVDRDKKAGYLLERLAFSPLLELSTDEVEAFSTEIVTTLYRNGVPFFSDFPVSRPVTMARTAFLEFLSGPGWHVADVTAPVIATQMQTAYAQIPNEDLERTLLLCMPGEVAGLVRAFKLRSYVRRSALTDERVSVTFVPLALLGACDEHDLDEALEAISRAFSLPSLQKAEWSSAQAAAKHRLLQMLASCLGFAAAATSSIGNAFEDQPWLEPTCASLYFGLNSNIIDELIGTTQLGQTTFQRVEGSSWTSAGLTPRSSRLLDDDDLRRLLWAQRELLSQVRLEEAPDQGQMTKIGIIASHAISSLFGYISAEFEEPQQSQIRGLADYDTYVKLFEEHPGERMLDQAFTMDDLSNAILGDRSSVSSWDRALISLGVDIGNDLGIVVPATLIDDVRCLVYRGYRLGETAQLARQPLARWRPDDAGEGLDAFTRAVLKGYPVRSHNVRLALPDTPTAAVDPDRQLRELAQLVQKFLPGKLIGLFEGRIIQVDDNGDFEAELTNLDTFDISQARLNIAQAPDGQRHLVRPGARFRWTIFERIQGDDLKDRISRLYLTPMRKLDEASIQEAADEFAFLADAE